MSAFLGLSLALARRELRGGLSGLRVFLAGLALGVAVIAGLGSLDASVIEGLHADGHAMLGGDVELHLVLRPASAEERAFLDEAGGVSEVVTGRAMARNTDGARRSLIELKAVDAAYPLFGRVVLDPPQDLATALERRQGTWGAVIAPSLATRLSVKVGDEIAVAATKVEVRALLTHEPDAASAAIAFGPRVMIARAALPTTGLLAPGTLLGFSYRIGLRPGSAVQPFEAALTRAFPSAGWQMRDFTDAAPSLRRLIDRVGVYLILIGLTALLVGGVGAGNAVRGYLQGKTRTIAILKCLGASGRLITTLYLIEILCLALVAIALGVVLGAGFPLIAGALLPPQFPVGLHVGLHPLPLLLAALFGLLTTLTFTLWPLGTARDVRPASLLRDPVEPPHRRPRLSYALAAALSAVALACLAIASAGDLFIAAWFVGGAALILLAFRLAALVLVKVASRLHPRAPLWRLAIANLHRPGASSATIIASLGLGLSVLVAIALIEGNITGELGERLASDTPSFFFIDILPDEVAAFDQLLKEFHGASGIARVPSLRGRITRLKDVPVEALAIPPDFQWVTRSERGLTYAASLPQGSRLVAGEWWPPDYRGPPLISFDAGLAKGLGLAVGDEVTVNVLGREVTARIANLREVDWASLGINFVIVMAPGTLEDAPQMHIATARVPPQDEAALERAVTDRFPNVSAIGVRDAVTTITALVAEIALVLRGTASLTLMAGALVLAGAVAATLHRRIREAVVLKAVGARRRDVSRIFLIEYGLLGAITAILSGGLGTLAAYLVLTRVMHMAWSFLPLTVIASSALGIAFTLAIGHIGIWRALGAKAAPYLRNE